MKNNKGFTLIEMVIVISIIAVLAAIIIPSVMWYLKKSRRVAAIADAKTILTGVQTALIERSLSGAELQLTKYGKIDGEYQKLGGITNSAINNAMKKNGITNANDTTIADSVVDMINDDINVGNVTRGSWIFNQNCQAFCSKYGANYAFIVLYTADGNVPFMQVYHNGILVTYASGSFVANDSDSAKFIKYGQSFAQPFIEAGEKTDDIHSRVKNSTFPSEWK